MKTTITKTIFIVNKLSVSLHVVRKNKGDMKLIIQKITSYVA